MIIKAVENFPVQQRTRRGLTYSMPYRIAQYETDDNQEYEISVFDAHPGDKEPAIDAIVIRNRRTEKTYTIDLAGLIKAVQLVEKSGAKDREFS